MQNRDTVIILGGASNALGQIRCAHEAGYKCINLVSDTPNKFSAKSRYCEGVLTPDPYKEQQACLRLLKDVIAKLSSKPYLFFSDDEWMMLVGEHENDIRDIAHIIQTPWNELVSLYDKKQLYRLAEKYGIPHPITIEKQSLSGLSEINQVLTFPCIVKPQLTVAQNELTEGNVKSLHRTQKFDTYEDAKAWATNLLVKKIDFPILVQEYIPGGAEKLYTLTSYSDEKGNLVAGSIGYKLRQFPPEAGRITAGVLHYEEKLHETAGEFLKKVKFHGVANTEFKYDDRDGEYKLMEINARFGAWNYSTLYSGINLMKIAIDDYNGRKYSGEAFKTNKDGHIWYNFMQDFGCTIVLNKREGFGKYALSPWKWWKSLGKYHFEGIFSWKDPLPFLFYGCYVIKDFWTGK